MSQPNYREETEKALKQYVTDTDAGLKNIKKIWTTQVNKTSKLEPNERLEAITEITQAVIEGYAPIFNEMSAEMFEELTGLSAAEFLTENRDVIESEVRRVVRAIANRSVYETNTVPIDALWGFVHKNLRSGGRDMIVRASERHGKRFARVPRGKTCAWCTMIASQGFVYASEKTAGKLKKFHDHCDCDIIPESQADLVKAMGFDFDEARKQYQAAEKARRADPDGKNREADYYMRRLFPDAYTDGVKPALSTKGWKFPGIPKKGEPTSHNTRELFKRQKALRSETHRESLYEHEIAFIERMENRGELLEWIPREYRQGIPTNDFIWISNDEEVCELKSTTDKYSTISKRIQRSVKTAAKNENNIVKDVFVVDIGDWPLSNNLANKLATYNLRHDEYKIRRLFVLSENGEFLREIALR